MPVMTHSRSFTGKFRRIFSFHLTLFICLAACAPLHLKAQDGNRTYAAAMGDSTAEVDVTVADVQGDIARIEGGMLIDISKAFIHSIAGGQRLDPSSIKPGMRIRASIYLPDNSSSPFVATLIEVRLENEMVLVGRLQAVDFENGSITILNRQIPISSDAFSAFPPMPKKLKVGRMVTVIAKLNGTELVATRIYLGDRAAYAGIL